MLKTVRWNLERMDVCGQSKLMTQHCQRSYVASWEKTALEFARGLLVKAEHDRQATAAVCARKDLSRTDLCIAEACLVDH